MSRLQMLIKLNVANTVIVARRQRGGRNGNEWNGEKARATRVSSSYKRTWGPRKTETFDSKSNRPQTLAIDFLFAELDGGHASELTHDGLHVCI